MLKKRLPATSSIRIIALQSFLPVVVGKQSNA